METAVQRVTTSAELGPLAATARDYILNSKAERTLRAYRSDWKHFTIWCQSSRLVSLPASPEIIALYLSHLAASCKVSTIARRIVAINQAHKTASVPSPTSDAIVSNTMKGIRRAKGSAPDAKSPTLMEDIRAMVGTLPAGILGTRDRALLLIGFAGAFRRSEIVSLNRADCEFTREGLVVTLRRSKTDQEGAGRKIAIPYGSSPDTCAVRSLQEWLQISRVEDGPVFRPLNRHGHIHAGRLSDKAVARAVKRYVAAAGLDPAKYSGHSLRAGLATAAAIAGASERSIMAQTGHRSLNMVRTYIRDGNLFRENAAAKVGM